jgi:hypothetical protein
LEGGEVVGMNELFLISVPFQFLLDVLKIEKKCVITGLKDYILINLRL